MYVDKVDAVGPVCACVGVRVDKFHVSGLVFECVNVDRVDAFDSVCARVDERVGKYRLTLHYNRMYNEENKCCRCRTF